MSEVGLEQKTAAASEDEEDVAARRPYLAPVLVEWLSEGMLAARVGVSRELLRESREQLAAGAWVVSPDQRVLWTRSAAEAVFGLIPEVSPVRVELLTVAWLPRNPRLLMGKTVAGELVRVRVARQVNFLPGMRLEAREEQVGLWVFEGRCPRFRGRW